MVKLVVLVCALALCPLSLTAEPTARLIHFTDDGTESGAPLLPGFHLHSLWNALGMTSDGTIYLAVSNHKQQPGQGNVAIFKLPPQSDVMSYVGDIRSASEAVGNWFPNETQYKVHTFLNQHADGLIYFATMPSDEPANNRGGHIYTLDPETDTIRDLSASLPKMITATGDVAASTGVTAAGQGIKGIAFTHARPDEIVFMTYDVGHLAVLNLTSGDIEVIGRSSRVSYIFHVDKEGDVYYIGDLPDAPQSLLRYNRSTGETTPIRKGFHEQDEIGMVAPFSGTDVIHVLFSRPKETILFNTTSETILRGGQRKICGKNGWRLYNLTASPDGKNVYVVSNNNKNSQILQAPAAGGKCRVILNVEELVGARNLAFGGQNIWRDGSFYTPVWQHKKNDNLAILKVTVD